MEERKDDYVQIEFTKSPCYRKIPATGAWGGLTNSGEIICNFFCEQLKTPQISKITFDSQTGQIKDEITIKGGVGSIYERELQVGIVMNPSIALAVGNWLIKRANEALSQNNGKEEKH